MNDFEPIIKNVSRFIDLTAEEKNIFASYLRMVKVKKKQFIVQPEFVCQYRTYVVTGALQAYLMGNDGQEHTIALAMDGLVDLGLYQLYLPGARHLVCRSIGRIYTHSAQL